MNTKHWIKIEAILDKALELPPSQQKAYLKKAGSHNRPLRDDLMAMWEAMRASEKTNFLQQATKENQALIEDLTNREVQSSFVGSHIGKYKIIEKVGAGGMGGVFKAMRADGEFSREVAIKLVPNGFHSASTLKRFQLEKQILAGLSHNNIARLYDGGVTKVGHPYLVMEFIDGMPLDDYCDLHRLTLYERLELFKDVCKAVQFAHRNLIVHRDLKCKNIYVTAKGEVKVLDFGIAKLLDPKLSEADLVETLPDHRFWTPYYAAPEQVMGEPITTVTDVYSLGILLYRLLTGTYPYDFRNKTLAEIRLVIAEKTPLTLTQALHKYEEHADLKSVAKNRNTTPGELKSKIRGDLEAIVSKAIEFKPAERYPSVGAFVADLQHYELNIPVKARRQGYVYRFCKFVRRHKKPVIAAFIIVALIGGISAIYAIQLKKKQQQATLAAEKAREVENLLTDIFKQSSPFNEPDKSVTLREVLDKGSQKITRGLKNQPLVKAELQGLMGQIYTNLGLYTRAQPLLEATLTLPESASQKEPSIYFKNLSRLAYLQFRQEQYQKAETLYLKSIHQAEALYPARSAHLAQLYHDVGFLYDEMGKRHKAIIYYRKALRGVSGEQTKLRTEILNDWGLIYQKQDEFVKAIALINQSIRLRRSLNGSISPELANSYNDLAYTYQRYGKLQQADSLHQITLAMRKKLFAPDHPHIASSLVRYGLLKIQEGQLKAADSMLSRGYIILQKRLPAGHWQVLAAKGGLAFCKGLEGEYKKNLPVLKAVYQTLNKRFGKKDWRTRETKKVYETLRKFASAREDNDITGSH